MKIIKNLFTSSVVSQANSSLAATTNKLNIWNEYVFPLKNKVTLNHEVITEAITSFFDKYVNHISDNEHIICLFRIKTTNNVILTIGQLQTLTKEDLKYYIDYIEGVLYIKSDEYMEDVIHDIIFSFGVKKGKVEKHSQIEHWYTKTQYQNYRNYKLPATMDIKKYGTIIHYDSQNQVTLVQITDLTLAKIKSVDNGYDVQILKKGIVLLNYKDRWVNENKFTRQIGENIFTFSREGSMDLFTVFKPTKYIKRVIG